MTRRFGNSDAQFMFENVVLLKSETIGIGSYGSVFKAKCDELLCAAKMLHPTLVDPSFFINNHDSPGFDQHRHPSSRFEQECQFLCQIRHPNIVQYIGLYRDPESSLPVLLMELMDESLTRFLESPKNPVLFHTQVNILSNIASAVAFLHKNQIIHRDLSSNNVLLIAGCRAKVTDFGMATLTDSTADLRGSMTLCPGTDCYMPPEALKVPPIYSEKMDCFSYGVLIIQVITRLFPKPTERHESFEFHNPLTGVSSHALRSVSEIERRKSHISGIHNHDPLLPIAFDCLQDRDVNRPTAREICARIEELKTSPKYAASVQHNENIQLQSRRERSHDNDQNEDQNRDQNQDRELSVIEPQLVQQRMQYFEKIDNQPRHHHLTPPVPRRGVQYQMQQLELTSDDEQQTEVKLKPTHFAPVGRNGHPSPPLNRFGYENDFAARVITSRNEARTNFPPPPPRLSTPGYSFVPPPTNMLSPPGHPGYSRSRTPPPAHMLLPPGYAGYSRSRTPPPAHMLLPPGYPGYSRSVTPPSARRLSTPLTGYSGSVTPPPARRLSTPLTGYSRSVTPPPMRSVPDYSIPPPRVPSSYAADLYHSAQSLHRHNVHDDSDDSDHDSHWSIDPSRTSHISRPVKYPEKKSRLKRGNKVEDKQKGSHSREELDPGKNELLMLSECKKSATVSPSTGKDGYVAVLYTPCTIPSASEEWEAVIAVYPRDVDCGHAFVSYLAYNLLGPKPRTASVNFQFSTTESMLLEIQSGLDGYEIESNPEQFVVNKTVADTAVCDYTIYPPRCVLTIIPTSDSPPRLNAQLTLHGAETKSILQLKLPRITARNKPSVQNVPNPSMHQVYSNRKQPSAQAAPRPRQRTHKPRLLTLSDDEDRLTASSVCSIYDDHDGGRSVLNEEPEVREFMQKVGSSIPTKWEGMAYEFGLHHREVELIRMNNTFGTNPGFALIRAVFIEWKKQSVRVRPTWHLILKALRSRQVSERPLADRLKRHLLEKGTPSDHGKTNLT